MTQRLIAPFVAISAVAGAIACFNTDQGQSPLESDPNATGATLRIEEVTNGFGRLLPHVVHAVDPVTGAVSSSQLVEIRSFEDLLANPPSSQNPVLPPSTWPATAINPAGNLGNHFVAVRFSRSLLTTSVLDPSAAGLGNNGLTGAIAVVAYQPATGLSTPIAGRGFINGVTYFGNPPRAERWVAPAGRDNVVALNVDRGGTTVQPGVGYPGTDDPANGVINGGFVAAGQLVSRTTFVFVVDSDENLSTYETFPQGTQGTDPVVIRVVVNETVRDRDRKTLADPGVATSSVGNDIDPPALLLDGVGGRPVTLPLHLSKDVPCDTTIEWSFAESVQPYSLGPLPGPVPPSLTPEFTVEFLPPVAVGSPPPGQRVQLPYTVLPVSPFDFTKFVLTPVTDFPGSDPFGATATAFVTYFQNAAIDLFLNQDPNSPATDEIQFDIGDCPGLVNVPVAPGAIYVASNGGGESGGIRVIDLDGFGQGTGDPTHDYVNQFYNATFNSNGEPISGDISKFPFNPNLQVQDIFPPLSADTTSIAGGSRGVFQLAQDSTLRTQLVDGSVVGTVGDMMLGHPLDIAFNNFDCLSGSLNQCASSSFQLQILNGVFYPGNAISHAPHPNPPRLRLAPSCYAPLIQGDEPTFGDANRDGVYATNRLQPGDAFGTLGGQGPSGLLTNGFYYSGGQYGATIGNTFNGPAPTSPVCAPFGVRQQIGHFLYVLDTAGDRVVVLNSNRMNVLDVIPVADPRDMAMAPDLNLLAVSNKGVNTVSFIDTDPNSPNFHRVIKSIQLIDRINNRVGLGPSEIAWQPGDEDILVVCENSNSMALVSTGNLEVRKIIPGVSQPRLIAASERDTTFGFQTGLYYGYVVSSTGVVTIFESGPSGPQGIGFDNFIGIPALDGRSGFPSAAAIQIDPNSFFHAVYIAYRNGSKGAVVNLALHDAPFGPRQTTFASFLPEPNFRTKTWRVEQDYVGVFSSSSVVDIAVDDLTNIGGTSSSTSVYAGNAVVWHSSKAILRYPAGPAPVSQPQFLFAANANGRVDVIDLRSGQPFVRPLVVPGAQVLCHYWRQ